MVSRASTELFFCIHRDFDVRNNVCKPHRLVCECCRDISARKSRGMKPTVLWDPGGMKATEYRDEANRFSNSAADNSVALTGVLETDYVRNGCAQVFGSARVAALHGCVRSANIDKHHKMIPCAIGHDIDSRPQSDMCSPDSWRIMEYEVTKHKSKACLRYNKIPSGAGMQL